MQWSIVGLNFLYAILGVVLMFIAYRVIDLLTPKVDFQEELKKGNVAVGMRCLAPAVRTNASHGRSLRRRLSQVQQAVVRSRV